MLTKESKIYIAGHRGMVGSALMRRFEAAGYNTLLTATHAQLDLRDQGAVRAFFGAQRPDVVVLAAARVGASWRTVPGPPSSCTTT